MELLDTISKIVEILAIILVYFVIGFGPGFIIGLLLANRIFGKDLPLRMDKNFASIKKAGEHNSQWHPNNAKWQ